MQDSRPHEGGGAVSLELRASDPEHWHPLSQFHGRRRGRRRWPLAATVELVFTEEMKRARTLLRLTVNVSELGRTAVCGRAPGARLVNARDPRATPRVGTGRGTSAFSAHKGHKFRLRWSLLLRHAGEEGLRKECGRKYRKCWPQSSELPGALAQPCNTPQCHCEKVHCLN